MQSLFKRMFIQFLILGLLVGLFYVLFWDKPAHLLVENLQDCRLVQIGEKTFNLRRAFTPEARELGLSGTKNLPEDSGMIFEFETHGQYGFWMKDMLIPIDIIFVNDDTVTDIYKSVTPETFPDSFFPKSNINFVIELNSGVVEKSNIQIEEKIKIGAPKSC